MDELNELRREAARLRVELLRARLLLKRAGDAINIRASQRLRAIRFQILNFLKEAQDENNQT